MKTKLLLFLTCLSFFNITAFAQQPATAFDSIKINNTKVFLSNGGDFISYPTHAGIMFDDSGTYKPLLYTTSLWMGGLDQTGNLHVASMLFRQNGADYIPGPISDDLQTTSNNFNTLYTLDKDKIQDHVGGKSTLPAIGRWPGSGNTGIGEPKWIAPFVDTDNNQEFEPISGETPAIRGDVATFSVFNDKVFHQESGGTPFEIDVRSMVYAFESDDTLEDVVLVHLSVTNRSANNYKDLFLGIFSDIDLGQYDNDFIGSDSSRNMYFGYNGDPDDGITGFGETPPAIGVVFLDHKMDVFSYYENNFDSLNGNPRTTQDYYSYLKGLDLKGNPIQTPSGKNTRYAFHGEVDKAGEWNEKNVGRKSGDRRGLGSIGPLDLESEGELCMDIAYVIARGADHEQSVKELKKKVDAVQFMYDKKKLDNQISFCENKFSSTKEERIQQVEVFPNPATTAISVKLPVETNEFRYQLIDLTGRTISNGTITGEKLAKIDISNLTSGIYHLVLNDGQTTSFAQFIKK